MVWFENIPGTEEMMINHKFTFLFGLYRLTVRLRKYFSKRLSALEKIMFDVGIYKLRNC